MNGNEVSIHTTPNSYPEAATPKTLELIEFGTADFVGVVAVLSARDYSNALLDSVASPQDLERRARKPTQIRVSPIGTVLSFLTQATAVFPGTRCSAKPGNAGKQASTDSIVCCCRQNRWLWQFTQEIADSL